MRETCPGGWTYDVELGCLHCEMREERLRLEQPRADQTRYEAAPRDESKPRISVAYRLLLEARPAWWAQAACSGADPRLFFAKWFEADTKQAVAICASCEVRDQCLADALAVDDDGVRGGMHERERRALRRDRSS